MKFESFTRWVKRNKVRLAAVALVSGALAPQLQPTITALSQLIDVQLSDAADTPEGTP